MSESNNNVPIPITQLQETETFDYESYLPAAKSGIGTKKVKGSTLLSELIDVRQGADGTTYASAGDAVRGQISNLEKITNEITKNIGASNALEINLTNYSVVKGIVNSAGVVVTDSSRIVTSDFIDISEFDYIQTEIAAGYKYNIALYADRNDEAFLAMYFTSGWFPLNSKYAGQANYIRVELMLSDTTLTPADITNIVIYGINNKTNTQIKEDIKALEGYSIDKIIDLKALEWENGTFNEEGGLVSSTSFLRTTKYIDVKNFEDLYIKNPTSCRTILECYDSNKTFIGSSNWVYDTYTINVSSVSYIKLSISYVPTNTMLLYDFIGWIIGGIMKTPEMGKREIEIRNYFKQGALVNGVLSSASTRISTRMFIDLRNKSKLQVIVPSNLYYAVVYYTDTNENNYTYGSPWTQDKTPIDVKNQSYCRITFRYANNTTITPSFTDIYNIYVENKVESINNRLSYEGERITIGNVLDFINIVKPNELPTVYAYPDKMQQGAAIYNGYVFMFRHHGYCAVYDLKTKQLVNEFAITDINADNPHCNNASFSKFFPSGNVNFPYVYVGRCSYTSDIPEGQTPVQAQECYVMNITTEGANVVQKIRYNFSVSEFVYTVFDWVVDRDRNKIIVYGHGAATAVSEQPWIFKVFNLPSVSEGAIVTLTDDDIIDSWVFETNIWGHTLGAIQGADVNGEYIIVPCSNPSLSPAKEAIVFISLLDHRPCAIFEVNKTLTDEMQAVACYNGDLYLVSAYERIDKLIFN